MNIPCSECLNENCAMKLCIPRWENLLAKNKGMLNYPKKTKIITQGSPVAGIYFIYSGEVKVYIQGRSGKEQIIRCAKDGDILGHRGYPAHNAYSISAEALSDTTLCFLEKDVFLELLEANPNLTYDMMFFYASEMRRMDELLMSMVELDTGERVANALLKMKEFFGVDPDGKTISSSISRQDLARFAGTVPEVVTRFLKELESQGIIGMDKRKISLLDEEALQDRAGNPEIVTEVSPEN